MKTLEPPFPVALELLIVFQELRDSSLEQKPRRVSHQNGNEDLRSGENTAHVVICPEISAKLKWLGIQFASLVHTGKGSRGRENKIKKAPRHTHR